MMYGAVIIFLLLILSSYQSEGLPVIIGFVLNASNGTDANNYSIVMWQPVNGRSVNQTDMIGEYGASALGNNWLIDCFDDPPTNNNDCDVDDVLNFEIIEQNGFTSLTMNFTISQDMIDMGFGEAPNVSMDFNFGPNITFWNPENLSTISGLQLVNASVQNLSRFNVSTVWYSIDNRTENHTKEAQPGNSTLPMHVNTFYYNDTFDTTLFPDGQYLLWVYANSSRGKWSYNLLNITINNTGKADLLVNFTTINFSDPEPYEGENITIFATVFNPGGIDVPEVTVLFYDGELIPENLILPNRTIGVAAGKSNITNVSYTPRMGSANITVILDPSLSDYGLIDESNESNNLVNTTLFVPAYTFFVGNLSGSFSLGSSGGSNLIIWNASTISGSNILVADSDSLLSFTSLKALGRDSAGLFVENDFSELDDLLDMENFSDSLNITYTAFGPPKNMTNFTVFSTLITNVSYANSTNTSGFITGILWDTDDDVGGDGQFDSADQEDIVFITRAQASSQGAYGVYDYEVRVPANLRRYKSPDTTTVTFFIEII